MAEHAKRDADELLAALASRGPKGNRRFPWPTAEQEACRRQQGVIRRGNRHLTTTRCRRCDL
eukprot:3072399-Lingulodinium_polyedra.AAC.1